MSDIGKLLRVMKVRKRGRTREEADALEEVFWAGESETVRLLLLGLASLVSVASASGYVWWWTQGVPATPWVPAFFLFWVPFWYVSYRKAHKKFIIAKVALRLQGA